MSTYQENMRREIPVPRYYQIVHQLEKFIQENNCAPGDKLPSEKELQTTYGVSRITAQRALGEMERLGLLTRRRGKGTYVASGFQTLNFAKFSGSLDDLFMIERARVVKEASVERVTAPPKVKQALKLTASNPFVTKVQRVLWLHGRPLGHLQSFYLESIGEIRREDVLEYPLLKLLDEKLQTPIQQIDQVIEAAVADAVIAKQLDVSFGFPLLYIERTLLIKKKKPVGFAQAYYRGDSYRLLVTSVRSDRSSSNQWRFVTRPRQVHAPCIDQGVDSVQSILQGHAQAYKRGI